MNKTLYIDADSLLYLTIFARANAAGGFDELEGGEDIGKVKIDMKPLKALFKSLVYDITTSCEVESAVGKMTKFKDVVCVFTGKTNFRYDIFPEYKAKRTAEKPKEFYKLKKWAIKKLGVLPEGVEADDYVNYMSRQGHPITSADKDVLYNTVGYHYDTYHKVFIKTTKKEAKRFLCIQALGGDATDGIPGLPGVGTKEPASRAEKLLNGEYDLKNVIQIYKDKGFDEERALTMIRSVKMDQIEKITKSGKIKVRLYK